MKLYRLITITSVITLLIFSNSTMASTSVQQCMKNQCKKECDNYLNKLKQQLPVGANNITVTYFFHSTSNHNATCSCSLFNQRTGDSKRHNVRTPDLMNNC